MAQETFEIKTDVFTGPLDLLLDLIRKQEINIYDIPIARITSQYLEYVQKAVEMDMELSAEFVYMASTLIHIKSKMLLPRDPELEKMDPEGDPRAELVRRLLEYKRFKEASAVLSRLDEEWREYYAQTRAQSAPRTAEDDEHRRFLMDSITEQVTLRNVTTASGLKPRVSPDADFAAQVSVTLAN